MSRVKPNLVLLHSFPTNSILLKGLSTFLSDFFNVYIIDLPGFVKTQKPLKEISIANYAHFVESEIKKLKLENYIIGGISFGFIVLLNMKLDTKCEGIFGIEPFVGRNSLRSKRMWKYTVYPLIDTVDRFNMTNYIWKNRVFEKLFSKYILGDLPPFVTKVILNEIDGTTFVKTLKLILTAPENHNLHAKLPHVLFINKQDSSIQSDYIEEVFKKSTKKLLIVNENIPHFPNDLSEEFFRSRFSDALILDSINFIKNN